jgi:hypothetical protein
MLGENQFCDERTGYAYNYVEIGEQIWMTKNLNFNQYNGFYADYSLCYGNDDNNCYGHGRLYNWAMAMAVNNSYNSSKLNEVEKSHAGICPQGWHIPSNAEWMNLIANKPKEDFFQFSGYKMEEKNSFAGFGEIASYWSTEQSLENNACVFSIRKNGNLERNCETNVSKKTNSHAIRCVKDNSIIAFSSSSEHAYSSSSSTKLHYYSSDTQYSEQDIQARDDRLYKSLDSVKNSTLGDGKKLEGHIFLLSIFVDTPTEKWTKIEKDAALERQKWALDWIATKANRHDILVGFEREAWGYIDQSIQVREVNTAGFSWLTGGARKYLDQNEDLNGYISRIKKVKKTENVRVIVYTKVTGRSHAIVTSDPGNRIHGGSYLDDATLIFAGKKDERFIKDLGTLFAHEFLHLFGADDLYEEEGGGAKDKYRESGQRSGKLKKSIRDVVTKKGKQDIMYDDYQPFSQLDISDLTACLLGWKKEPENWFKSAINKCR